MMIDMTIKKCSVDGCEKTNQITRGYCGMHYQRVMRYGTPDGRFQKFSTWAEALDARTAQQGDCLVWTGSTNEWGYGRAAIGGGKQRVVHHLAWERAGFEIPEGMELDHECFNRACVNVAHLRLATKSQNAWHRKGAQPNSKSGIRGVHVYGGRWQVRFKVDGEHVRFGVFDTIEEAAEVAEAKLLELEQDHAK